MIFALAVVCLAAVAVAGWATAWPPGGATPQQVVPATAVPPAALPSLSPKDFVADLKESRLVALSFIFAENDDAARKAASRLDLLEVSMRERLDALRAATSGEKQRRILDQAGESLAFFVDAEQQARRFKQAGKRELAEATLYGNVAPYATELEQILHTLEIEQRRERPE